MIRHIVFWKLKDEAEGGTKAENIAKIKAMLERLVGIVPGLVSAQVGANVNGGEYDACLVSEFESMEALHAYDSHPEHLKVRSFVKAVRISRTSVDHEM
ncbi:MAG: Dabb family protein [Ruminococcaceae bacterium]|nr:Dabb family protein [Oscillospiraceae bacterium]